MCTSWVGARRAAARVPREAVPRLDRSLVSVAGNVLAGQAHEERARRTAVALIADALALAVPDMRME